MTNLFEMYETKEEFEVDGVWQDLGMAKVLLARSGGVNTIYLKTLSDESKKLGKATFDALDEDEMVEIIRTAFCKAVIKDHLVKNDKGAMVKGVLIRKDDKVEIVPYNLENMKTCLKQLPEYFKKLQEWASDYKTFQDEVVEKQIKN